MRYSSSIMALMLGFGIYAVAPVVSDFGPLKASAAYAGENGNDGGNDDGGNDGGNDDGGNDDGGNDDGGNDDGDDDSNDLCVSDCNDN